MSLFDIKYQNYMNCYINKEITVSDLVDESYKRIQEVDDKVKAFLTLDEENARQSGKEIR